MGWGLKKYRLRRVTTIITKSKVATSSSLLDLHKHSYIYREIKTDRIRKGQGCCAPEAPERDRGRDQERGATQARPDNERGATQATLDQEKGATALRAIL